jgi:hypothetical protein
MQWPSQQYVLHCFEGSNNVYPGIPLACLKHAQHPLLIHWFHIKSSIDIQNGLRKHTGPVAHDAAVCCAASNLVAPV